MDFEKNYDITYKVNYPFCITGFYSLYEHCWEGAYTFSGESHNFWEFTCVLEGELESTQGEQIYLLKAGSFIGCPPMVFHRCRSTGKTCRVLNFSFAYTGMLPPSFAEGIFYLSGAEMEEIKRIVCKLRSAYQQEPVDTPGGAEAAFALASFLLRLSAHHTPHIRRIDSRSGVMYQKLVESMRGSICENLTIGQIVAQNAISATAAKELFHKYAGISPKAYYMEIRGNEALRLLKTGKEIREVSEMLNYSSPNYFSCCFKKQFGLPPGQYIKRLQEADALLYR